MIVKIFLRMLQREDTTAMQLFDSGRLQTKKQINRLDTQNFIQADHRMVFVESFYDYVWDIT